MKKHLETPVLSCGSCSSTFRTSYGFSKHQKKYHRAGANDGNDSDATVVSDGETTNKIIRPPESFNCTYCNNFYMNKLSLNKHVADSHPTFAHECKVCGKHYIQHHVCSMLLLCDLCSLVCKTLEELTEHTMRMHVNIPTSQQPMVYEVYVDSDDVNLIMDVTDDTVIEHEHTTEHPTVPSQQPRVYEVHVDLDNVNLIMDATDDTVIEHTTEHPIAVGVEQQIMTTSMHPPNGMNCENSGDNHMDHMDEITKTLMHPSNAMECENSKDNMDPSKHPPLPLPHTCNDCGEILRTMEKLIKHQPCPEL